MYYAAYQKNYWKENFKTIQNYQELPFPPEGSRGGYFCPFIYH